MVRQRHGLEAVCEQKYHAHCKRTTFDNKCATRGRGAGVVGRQIKAWPRTSNRSLTQVAAVAWLEACRIKGFLFECVLICMIQRRPCQHTRGLDRSCRRRIRNAASPMGARCNAA